MVVLTIVISMIIKLFYNQAWMNGGVVYWAGANGVINNSNFTNNTSIKNGSAIYWNVMNGSVNNCYFTVKKKLANIMSFTIKNQLSLYITILLNLNMLFITWALLIV